MRASIVITNFNYAPFLADSVGSALAQSLKSEVIVVDDGSTDDSRQALEEFGDRIRLILQENRGQASALNTGIAVSTGDIVLLLDADDYIELDRAESVAAALDTDPAAQWVRHSMYKVDGLGNRTGGGAYRMLSSDARHDIIRRGRTPGLTSVLAFRRGLLDRICPIPEFYVGYADWYLLVAAALTAPGAHIPRQLSARRMHDQRHFTAFRSTDFERARFHLALRNQIAADAAQIAEGLEGLSQVAEAKTWWQAKARFEWHKGEGDPIRMWRTDFIRHLRALSDSPLPPREKLLIGLRSLAVAATPSFAFHAFWWLTNEGRRELTPGLHRAATSS